MLFATKRGFCLTWTGLRCNQGVFKEHLHHCYNQQEALAWQTLCYTTSRRQGRMVAESETKDGQWKALVPTHRSRRKGSKNWRELYQQGWVALKVPKKLHWQGITPFPIPKKCVQVLNSSFGFPQCCFRALFLWCSGTWAYQLSPRENRFIISRSWLQSLSPWKTQAWLLVSLLLTARELQNKQVLAVYL